MNLRKYRSIELDESPKNYDLSKTRESTVSGPLLTINLTVTFKIQCSVACGHGYQQRQVKCQTHDGRLSTHCHKAYRPVSKQNCRGQRCNEGANDPLPTDDKCVDINKVAYCPLGTDLNKNSAVIETCWYRGPGTVVPRCAHRYTGDAKLVQDR